MLNVKSRLHMHNHKEPNGTAYIVGERSALRELGEALIKASKSPVGFDQIAMYTSDGHRYEIIMTCSVSEEEWQTMPVPYDRKHDPSKLEIIKLYSELKTTA